MAPPDDPARRSGPWPSGRTWYLASRLLAAIEAVSPGHRVLQGAALAGLVGDQALPFLEYRETLNLPDPEDILKDPRRFVLPDRVDRAYAVCYSLAGAVLNNKTPQRWEAAMIALGVASRKNADIPAAAARTLCAKANRPEGVLEAARGVPSVLRADATSEARSKRMNGSSFRRNDVGIRLVDLIRRPVPPKLQLFRKSEAGPDQKSAGYSRTLQAARVRAAHQRSYFAPALFNLVPVETTLIGSMAVDSQWRLYYNEAWLAAHSVEQNASLLVHEVSHLLRDHEGRKKAAGIRDHRRWNTAGDCEINDDLQEEGLPLPGDPPLPARYGLRNGERAETYYHQLPAPPRAGDHAIDRRRAGLRIRRTRRAPILGAAGRRWQ